MQSRLEVKNFTRAFFVFGLAVSLIYGGRCPRAEAADLMSGVNLKNLTDWNRGVRNGVDYTASYEENFYSTATKNTANTTGVWKPEFGYISLSPAAGAVPVSSYKIEEETSILAGFKGPVSIFANDSTVPIFGSAAGSLVLPIEGYEGVNTFNFSDRLVDFSAFDMKAMGISYRGDVEGYLQQMESAMTPDATKISLGNDETYAYLLVGGDNAGRVSGTKSVKLNRIKAVSFSMDGTLATQTEDVSSLLSALDFEAITDISCAETECLVAGTNGKLASYDGKTFTDLSGKLGSSADDLELTWVEDYFLIAGNDYVASKYIGRIYKYEAGGITKISDDSLFVSETPGSFALAPNFSEQWLIVKGGKNVLAYLYSGGKFADVGAKISKFYPSGSMVPGIQWSLGDWFIFDKGSTGAILRFDGESATNIRDALGFDTPIYAISPDGNMTMVMGGGTASSPKLYSVSDVAYSAVPSSYAHTGVVESLKVNKTTRTITSAYIASRGDFPSGTSVKYYLSSDGGSHWEELIRGSDGAYAAVTFSNPGSDLRWKVVMSSDDGKKTPTIFALDIFYTEGPLAPATPVEGLLLQSGELVRAANDAKVYIIMDGRKRWVVSVAEFQLMGYEWSKVKTVPAESLASFPEVKLIKAKGTDGIYYITGAGMKKLILNDAVFQSYGNKYTDVVELEQKIVDLYSTVTFIQGADGKVWQITGATKKWISSTEEFWEIGGKWSEVTAVNDIELAAYAKAGDPVLSAASSIVDGDLLRAVGSPDIYIVKIVGAKKFIRLVLTPDVFNSYGHLRWENVKEVNAATLGEFKESGLVTVFSNAAVSVSSDIYLLTGSGDSGNRDMVSTADFISGTYDIDSVYIINAVDFSSYAERSYGTNDIPPTPIVQGYVMSELTGRMIMNDYGWHFGINCDKLGDIFQKLIVKERDLPATEMRTEFQKYLSESNISAADAVTVKYLMQKTVELEKLVLIDASESLSTKSSVKSSERQILEQELITKYPKLKSNIEYIDYTISQAVAGKVVNIFDSYHYLDYASVEKAEQEFDENLEARIGQLF